MARLGRMANRYLDEQGQGAFIKSSAKAYMKSLSGIIREITCESHAHGTDHLNDLIRLAELVISERKAVQYLWDNRDLYFTTAISEPPSADLPTDYFLGTVGLKLSLNMAKMFVDGHTSQILSAAETITLTALEIVTDKYGNSTVAKYVSGAVKSGLAWCETGTKLVDIEAGDGWSGCIELLLSHGNFSPNIIGHKPFKTMAEIFGSAGGSSSHTAIRALDQLLNSRVNVTAFTDSSKGHVEIAKDRHVTGAVPLYHLLTRYRNAWEIEFQRPKNVMRDESAYADKSSGRTGSNSYIKRAWQDVDSVAILAILLKPDSPGTCQLSEVAAVFGAIPWVSVKEWFTTAPGEYIIGQSSPYVRKITHADLIEPSENRIEYANKILYYRLKEVIAGTELLSPLLVELICLLGDSDPEQHSRKTYSPPAYYGPHKPSFRRPTCRFESDDGALYFGYVSGHYIPKKSTLGAYIPQGQCFRIGAGGALAQPDCKMLEVVDLSSRSYRDHGQIPSSYTVCLEMLNELQDQTATARGTLSFVDNPSPEWQSSNGTIVIPYSVKWFQYRDSALSIQETRTDQALGLHNEGWIRADVHEHQDILDIHVTRVLAKHLGPDSEESEEFDDSPGLFSFQADYFRRQGQDDLLGSTNVGNNHVASSGAEDPKVAIIMETDKYIIVSSTSRQLMDMDPWALLCSTY